MVDDYGDNGDKFKFNMAVAMLFRIDNIITQCANASSDKNFPRWSRMLSTLSREINYLFKPEEEKENLEFENSINPLIVEFEEKMEFNIDSEEFVLKDGVYFDNYPILYTLLIGYEKFLRKALQERDLLAIKKSDLRRIITEMQ